MPRLSAYIKKRNPSAIRAASIEFAKRKDGATAVNVAIGNVSLPMHPAMIRRLNYCAGEGSPFEEGRVMYSSTVGRGETRAAFRNILGASGFFAQDLLVQVTNGGSQAMELLLLAVCGPAGTSASPLMMIDAAYTNYRSFADRLGRKIISFPRHLSEDGDFEFPSIEQIEAMVVEHNPGALLVIPYDNPTGHLYTHQQMVELAQLCVRHDMWFVSDEAYRELYYNDEPPVSVWRLSEDEVPGITGRRVSLETASKVWNACGLRIGALVTDNDELHNRCVAENTVSLCSNVLGQYIFGSLAGLSFTELRSWFAQQRAYYFPMLQKFTNNCRKLIPEAIVSKPAAAIYQVVDLRKMVGPDFVGDDFVMWCAKYGRVSLNGKFQTLLTAPLTEFYAVEAGKSNAGRTQLRVAFVETPEVMEQVPYLLAELLEQYLTENVGLGRS